MSPRCHDLDKVNDWLRGGDVIVSSPYKSGTTWTIQTVQSIRTHGKFTDFEDMDMEVPWMEFRHYPGQTWKDHIEHAKIHWNGFNDTFYKYRVFKSHEGAPVIHFRDDVKYIVSFRKPIEAVSSFQRFVQIVNPRMANMWGFPNLSFETEEELKGFFVSGGFVEHQICDFVNGWWPHLKKPNVFANHYTTLMKADRRETVKRFAKFLGEDLSEEEISLVINQTSIEEMRKNEHKYITRKVWEPFKKMGLVPKDVDSILLPGGMIGTGGDVKSIDIKKRFPNLEKRVNDRVHECIKDKEALKWLYNLEN